MSSDRGDRGDVRSLLAWHHDTAWSPAMKRAHAALSQRALLARTRALAYPAPLAALALAACRALPALRASMPAAFTSCASLALALYLAVQAVLWGALGPAAVPLLLALEPAAFAAFGALVCLWAPTALSATAALLIHLSLLLPRQPLSLAALAAYAAASLAAWLGNAQVRAVYLASPALLAPRLALVAAFLALTFLALASLRRSQHALYESLVRVAIKQRVANAVLLARLPQHAQALLLAGGASSAARVRDVSIIFIEVCDFGKLVARCAPAELVETLEALWAQCMACAARHGVRCVEVSGGVFVGVAGSEEEEEGGAAAAAAPCPFGVGVTGSKEEAGGAVAAAAAAAAAAPGPSGSAREPPADHAAAATRFALSVLGAHAASPAGERFAVSAGVASGNAMAGFVGSTRLQHVYVGDVVNAASRMASLASLAGGGCLRMMSATALQVAGGGLRASAERVHVRGFGAIDVYAPVSAAAAQAYLAGEGAGGGGGGGDAACGAAAAAAAAACAPPPPPPPTAAPPLSLSFAPTQGATPADYAAAAAACQWAAPLGTVFWGFAEGAREAAWRAREAPRRLASLPSALLLAASAGLTLSGALSRLPLPWGAALWAPLFVALSARFHIGVALAAVGTPCAAHYLLHPASTYEESVLVLMCALALPRLFGSARLHIAVAALALGVHAARQASGEWPPAQTRPELPSALAVLLCAGVSVASKVGDELTERASFAALAEAERARDAAHAALDALLPPALSAQLREGRPLSELTAVQPNVALLNLDIVGFTALTHSLRNPRTVFQLLNSAFAAIERIAAAEGAFKVKSVGDALLFAVGLGSSPDALEDGARARALRAAHAAALLRVAAAIQRAVAGELPALARAHGVPPLVLRLGLHVGSVVAGAVSVCAGAAFFDVFGASAAAALAAEAASPPGGLLVTAAAAVALHEAELPGLQLAPHGDGAHYHAALAPEAPLFSWGWDVFREPIAGDDMASRESLLLYGMPVRPPCGALPPPPPPSARAMASGEARLACAALALLRGAHGEGLARAGVSERAGAAYVAAIRARYAAYNSFHNWRHVVSVAHASALVLSAPRIAAAVPARLALAVCAAALGHDAGHRGTTSAFEIKLRTALAAANGGEGPVLERHHAAVALACLAGSGALEELPAEGAGEVAGAVRAAIMATDMGVHGAVLASLEARAARVAGGGALLVEGSAPDAEAFAGELLHATDLSAAVYSHGDMVCWAGALYAEFCALPERERAACLPVTPFFADLVGAPLAQARMQAGFVRGVVRPLWAALARLAGGALDAQVARVDASIDFHEREAARLERAQ